MVHNKSEAAGSNISNMRWMFNIPFAWVEADLILQLKHRHFGYDEFKKWGELMDKIPTVWTMGLLDEKSNVHGFAYGTWNPLEREIEIKRATVKRNLFSIRGDILREALKEMRKFKESMGALHMYWLTPKPKVFLRKLPEDVKEIKYGLLEVL